MKLLRQALRRSGGGAGPNWNTGGYTDNTTAEPNSFLLLVFTRKYLFLLSEQLYFLACVMKFGR